MHRAAAVAGQFYPGDGLSLREAVVAALAAEGPETDAFGVMAPHAGYVYSGAVAGAVFGRVRVPDTVLLLGPNHTGAGTPASIASSGSWETPLGAVEIDAPLAQALREACPLLQEDTRAHAREHSLEVQLPFLQVRNPQLRVVPIAFQLRTPREVAEVGRAVAAVLAARADPVLIVASSDMTHYEPRDEAARKDHMALERVLAIDAAGLLDVVASHRISMCGVIPTAVLLEAAAACGAPRGELVRYATSGEVSGDFQQVVGYAGVVIPRPAREAATPA